MSELKPNWGDKVLKWGDKELRFESQVLPEIRGQIYRAELSPYWVAYITVKNYGLWKASYSKYRAILRRTDRPKVVIKGPARRSEQLALHSVYYSLCDVLQIADNSRG